MNFTRARYIFYRTFRLQHPTISDAVQYFQIKQLRRLLANVDLYLEKIRSALTEILGTNQLSNFIHTYKVLRKTTSKHNNAEKKVSFFKSLMYETNFALGKQCFIKTFREKKCYLHLSPRLSYYSQQRLLFYQCRQLKIYNSNRYNFGYSR